MNKKNIRYYDLDLLRFLAAISVVLFHYTFRGYSADNLSNISYNEISFITKYGYLGVELFFMISGFVILMTAQSGSVKKFLISRFTRLYPTFWMGVLFTTIFIYLFDAKIFDFTIKQFFINLTMVPQFFSEKPIDGVYWTLLIELKFYFLIVLIILIKQLKNIKIFFLLWILWSIFYYYYSFPSKFNPIFFPTSSSYFIAGSMFFLIKKEGLSLMKLIIIILSFISACLYSTRYLIRQTEHFNTDFSSISVISILFCFYVVFLLISLEKSNFFNRKIYFYLGILTYPLYLIHQNVGYILINYFENSLNKYLLLFLIILFMLGISYLIYYFIDNKFSNNLKFKLTNLFLKENNV